MLHILLVITHSYVHISLLYIAYVRIHVHRSVSQLETQSTKVSRDCLETMV